MHVAAHEVCIIYSRKDDNLPAALEKALMPEWSVWWDRSVTGDFRQAIENAIRQAKCVVPIWSSSSRQSEIVIDEASFAKKCGVPLLPILIDQSINPPLGFGSIDSIDMFDWEGELTHPGLNSLREKLRLIAPNQSPGRPRSFSISKTELHSPTFFFSVSSHETRLPPADTVKALTLFGAHETLVSAYDLYKEGENGSLGRALKRASKSSVKVLLDSGNYEASRKADLDWNEEKLHAVLSTAPHDFAFCFDKMDPSNNRDRMVKSVVSAVERDAKHTTKPVLPIVHAPRARDGSYILEHIPDVFRKVAEALAPPLIAIPERELGPGIVAKAKTIVAIRESLSGLRRYQPIHILGTGNPLSIAVLAAVGADSFDGLEWCRVVADASNNTLYHFEQYDFFAYQTRVARSSIVREAANSDMINYAGKALFHNMDFFSQFVEDLRAATFDGRLIRFLTERLPAGSMSQLEAALPKVF